jgi:hypothetical protein
LLSPRWQRTGHRGIGAAALGRNEVDFYPPVADDEFPERLGSWVRPDLRAERLQQIVDLGITPDLYRDGRCRH